MEQVFYRQHVRLMRLLSPFKTIRRVVEKYILINAFICAFILCWLHISYVNRPASIHSNCLYQALGKKNFTYDLADYDVIRLHISNEEFNHFQQEEHVRGSNNPISRELSSGSNEKSLENSSLCSIDDDIDVVGLSNRSSSQLHSSTDIVNSTTADNQELPLLFDKFISNVGLHIDETKKAPRQDPKESRGRGGGSARLYNVAERLGWTHITNNADEEEDRKHVFEGQGGELKDLFVSQRVYLFSLEKGYLMLRADQRDRHAIRRLDIMISSDSRCFGSPAAAWLLRTCVGYDTVVMNWLISIFGGQGYLYNIYSKELFNLNFATEFSTIASSGSSSDGGSNNATVNALSSLSTIASSRHNDMATALAALRERIKEGKSDGDDHDDINKHSPSQATIPQQKQQYWFDRLCLRLSRVGGRSRGRLTDLSFSALRQFVAFKIGVIVTTVFLFFTTTTLVSFTLRETQERMLKFTFMLQHHISHRIPYAALVITHVVETLVFVPIMVGILFFLFEFFSDQLLAFMVLSGVWLAECFSVVCLRSGPSIRFFPRVFFCYFSMFHIYCFSFPFGFSYLAFGTTVLFIVHSMLFCWNAFEVPAMESGLITAITPRVGMQAIVAVGSSSSFHPGMNQVPFNPALQSDPFSPTLAQQSALGAIGSSPGPSGIDGAHFGSGIVVESQSYSSSHHPVGGDVRIVEVGTTTDIVGLPTSSSPTIISGGESSRADLGNPTHDDNGTTIRDGGVSSGDGAMLVRPSVRPLGSPVHAPFARIRTTESRSPGFPSPPSRGWPGGGGGFPASSSEGSLLLRLSSDNLSHSHTSLLPTPLVSSTPTAAHNFPASDFYNRQHHFDLSRRIQAEQLSAMLGLPPSRHGGVTSAHSMSHHILEGHSPSLIHPYSPFNSPTPPFVASPSPSPETVAYSRLIHVNPSMNNSHVAHVAATFEGPYRGNGDGVRMSSFGDVISEGDYLSGSSGVRDGEGSAGFSSSGTRHHLRGEAKETSTSSYPISLLVNMGRAIGNNLSWIASAFATDDDSSLGTDGELTSQGDLASEGSEWLMAGNDTDDADGDTERQGRYRRRRPTMSRHRQQRVLRPRSNRLTGTESPSDSMDYDEDDNRVSSDVEHREQRRRGRGGSDQKNPHPAKTNGSPCRNNGASLTTAPLSPPNTRVKKQQQYSSSPSSGVAAFLPSKTLPKYRSSSGCSSSRGSMYEEEECENNHYHRELVMYGSSDFDLSKEIASARASVNNSVQSSPISHRTNPNHRRATVESLDLPSHPTGQETLSQQARVRSRGEHKGGGAVTIVSSSVNCLTSLVTGDDEQVDIESTTEHDSHEDRCSNTATTTSGSHSWITSTNVITRFRTESLCSRGSDGATSAVSGMHSVGLGGLQPIISSASLASAGMLSSPGGSHDMDSVHTNLSTRQRPAPSVFPLFVGSANANDGSSVAGTSTTDITRTHTFAVEKWMGEKGHHPGIKVIHDDTTSGTTTSTSTAITISSYDAAEVISRSVSPLFQTAPRPSIETNSPSNRHQQTDPNTLTNNVHDGSNDEAIRDGTTPLKRPMSENDFGYKKAEFRVFGNDFIDD